MFQVTLTRADGYIFNNFFDSLAEAREFMESAGKVMFPGETLKISKI
jgi:hypothetical protein